MSSSDNFGMRGSSWGVSTSAKSKRHGLRAFREWRSVAEGIEGSGHVVCLGARSWRCLLCKEAWVENRSDQRFLTSWFILWPPSREDTLLCLVVANTGGVSKAQACRYQDVDLKPKTRSRRQDQGPQSHKTQPAFLPS